MPDVQGDITQLVECLLCKQKVAGSNPVISTVTVVYGMAQQTVALLDRVRLPAVTPKEDWQSGYCSGLLIRES